MGDRRQMASRMRKRVRAVDANWRQLRMPFMTSDQANEKTLYFPVYCYYFQEGTQVSVWGVERGGYYTIISQNF